MNQDVSFAFEHAGWPVFLVDRAGLISYANRMALKVFNPELEHLPVSLGQVWGTGNPVSAEQFPTHWESNPQPAIGLRFKVRTGAVAYTAALCS